MSGLDDAWLYDRYRELHEQPPNSRARDYIRGRIDEYCAQNAVSQTSQAAARARALADLQAGIIEVHDGRDPCAHGCYREATVQHADGRFLCKPCYRAETGASDRAPGCPTCG